MMNTGTYLTAVQQEKHKSAISQALSVATAGDIQDIADILGVTFQEHCVATTLKVRSLKNHQK